MDEHPDSINDAAFGVQMPGNTPATAISAQQGLLVDLPASHHGGGAGFSFADGHSEIKRWRGDANSTKRPVMHTRGGNFSPANFVNKGIFDLRWFARNTTAYRDGTQP